MFNLYENIRSFFEDHSVGLICVIVGIIAVIVNIGIFVSIGYCSYHLLKLSLYVMWGSADLGVVLGLIGLLFPPLLYVALFCIVPFFESCEWLILYFIIRFCFFAFNGNYMNYNFSYIQWIAIWLICFVIGHICGGGSSSDSDSDSDSDNDSNNEVNGNFSEMNSDSDW